MKEYLPLQCAPNYNLIVKNDKKFLKIIRHTLYGKKGVL